MILQKIKNRILDLKSRSKNQLPQAKNCIVVLGMHRSGTSAITKYLTEIGFELPSPPLPAHPVDNPDGYLEPKDLVSSNNRFFDRIGIGWKGIQPIETAEFDRPTANIARDEIQTILGKGLVHGNNFVLKDPRLCRMAPLYIPILRKTFDRVSVVHIIRSPQSVFNSLAYRAKVSDIKKGAITNKDHAYFLWLRYNLDAEAWASSLPTYRINYETWINSPKKSSQKLRDWLRLNFTDVKIKNTAPKIKSPRSVSSCSNKETLNETAQITELYLQSIFSSNFDHWNNSGINKTFSISIPDFYQQEVDKPSYDLIAAAYVKHLTGLHDSIALTRTQSAENLTNSSAIVFISDRPKIPCHTYRVKNMVDALNADGITATWTTSASAEQDFRIIENAKLVVVHRSFWSNSLDNIFNFCNQHKIPIASDIDDLIFDENLIESGQIDFISNLSKAAINEWKNKARMFRETLLAADFCITSTPLIRDHLIATGKHAVCIPNGFSVETADLSAHWHSAFSMKNITKKICYASGSMTHNSDFDVIAQPVSAFLNKHPDWTLTIIGQLDINAFMEHFNKEQIEVRPLVDHINLAYELARVDINLIPLVRNPFNDAKSSLKWYESALCGVPSIATNNPIYNELLDNGCGLLANNSEEWLAHMITLADSLELREKIAEAAKQKAEKLFGPAETSRKWKNLLESMGSRSLI